MKKQSRINLHNLSKSEIVNRELNLLKGGVVCLVICGDQICRCEESAGGGFPDSDAAMDAAFENTDLAENTVNHSFRVNNP